MIRIFAILLLAGPLAAQGAPVTGKLLPVPGPTVCQQGETHVLEGVPGLFLKSSALDLTQWENQTVTLSGRDVGVTCTVWEVTSVDDADVQLDWFGNPVPGGPVYFESLILEPSGSHQYAVFASRDFTFQPAGPQAGTVLIGTPRRAVCSGIADPFDVCAILLPPNPALSGTTIRAQMLGFHAHPELSNTVLIEVL